MAAYPRVLVVRVGWMHYYHNVMPDDKPYGTRIRFSLSNLIPRAFSSREKARS